MQDSRYRRDIKYFDEMESNGRILSERLFLMQRFPPFKGMTSPDLEVLNSEKKIAEYMTRYYPSIPSGSFENEIIELWRNRFICNNSQYFEDIFRRKTDEFYLPEASFLANVKIAEMFLGEGNCLKLPKPSKSEFFFSSEQIQSLYEGKSILIRQIYTTLRLLEIPLEIW